MVFITLSRNISRMEKKDCRPGKKGYMEIINFVLEGERKENEKVLAKRISHWHFFYVCRCNVSPMRLLYMYRTRSALSILYDILDFRVSERDWLMRIILGGLYVLKVWVSTMNDYKQYWKYSSSYLTTNTNPPNFTQTNLLSFSNYR